MLFPTLIPRPDGAEALAATPDGVVALYPDGRAEVLTADPSKVGDLARRFDLPIQSTLFHSLKELQ